jgi:hypothetical protein
MEGKRRTRAMKKGLLLAKSEHKYGKEGLARLKEANIEPIWDASWVFMAPKSATLACSKKVMWVELGRHTQRVFDFLQRVHIKKYEVFENNYAIPVERMAKVVLDAVAMLGIKEGEFKVEYF